MEKYITVKENRKYRNMSTYVPDVVFSTATGVELKMQLVLPRETDVKHPLFVFLQGSGWTFPNVYPKMAMFMDFAEKGIAVAMITHRNRNKGYPAPAFLQDAKTAVRFLRANADKYCIDKDKVYFGGSSSGGNTALLMGQTGDDPRYKTEEYAEESDAVSGVVDSCGPSDLLRFAAYIRGTDDWMKNEFCQTFCGKDATLEERIKIMEEMSPERVFKERRVMQPTLFIHGSEDRVVLPLESESMYKTLEEAGCECYYVNVEGAKHDGDGVMSREVYDIILEFILGLTNKS
ncbi:MAG: alpha/beta hydrolase [Clostridia bacterium]|nr:alpha/beta hydrolase [Clostridia bacterium]MBQ5809227.1 alpha/beta hydrolase [Clostridia bacterium]